MERQEYLMSIYRKALGAGLCTNKSTFAEIVGVYRTTMSSAMNGDPKFLNDVFMRRLRRWAEQNGLDGEQAPPMAAPSNDIPATACPMEWVRYYTRKLEEKDRIIDRLVAVLAQAGESEQKKITG